jgi:hypothetical protein
MKIEVQSHADITGIIKHEFVLPKQPTKYFAFKISETYGSAFVEKDQIFGRTNEFCIVKMPLHTHTQHFRHKYQCSNISYTRSIFPRMTPEVENILERVTFESLQDVQNNVIILNELSENYFQICFQTWHSFSQNNFHYF